MFGLRLCIATLGMTLITTAALTALSVEQCNNVCMRKLDVFRYGLNCLIHRSRCCLELQFLVGGPDHNTLCIGLSLLRRHATR